MRKIFKQNTIFAIGLIDDKLTRVNFDLPDFKKISLSDKGQIDKIFQDFSPYCDFNFSNIYNWSSISKPSEIAFVNENLVVKMKDFVEDHVVVSFIGNNKISDTVSHLLDHFDELSMIPEECITNELLERKDLLIEEDRNNHDYILSLKDLIDLPGNRFKSKRRKVKKFLEKNPDHTVQVMDLKNDDVWKLIEDLTFLWNLLKRGKASDINNELNALKRQISLANVCEIIFVGVYIDDKLIAFTTNEIKHDGFAIGSFGKADFRYDGIFSYSEHITAKHLYSLGCKFLNYEQDLGLDGLRKSKLSWKPVRFLKKYKIRQLKGTLK